MRTLRLFYAYFSADDDRRQKKERDKERMTKQQRQKKGKKKLQSELWFELLPPASESVE